MKMDNGHPRAVPVEIGSQNGTAGAQSPLYILGPPSAAEDQYKVPLELSIERPAASIRNPLIRNLDLPLAPRIQFLNLVN